MAASQSCTRGAARPTIRATTVYGVNSSTDNNTFLFFPRLYKLERMAKKTKNSDTAFFYGTLMSPAVLRRVIFGQALPDSTTHRTLPAPQPALLQNFQRHRVDGADYPAIIPQNGSSVRGTLVTGLTDGDWWRLDIFEGSQYKREYVKVLVQKGNHPQRDAEWNELDEKELESAGEEVMAQTYVWKDDLDDLEPREWDFEEFVKEKMWRWAGTQAEDEGEYDGMCARSICSRSSTTSFRFSVDHR